MEKEELIKLAEALASVGYEISKLDYKQVEDPPLRFTNKLSLQ